MRTSLRTVVLSALSVLVLGCGTDSPQQPPQKPHVSQQDATPSSPPKPVETPDQRLQRLIVGVWKTNYDKEHKAVVDLHANNTYTLTIENYGPTGSNWHINGEYWIKGSKLFTRPKEVDSAWMNLFPNAGGLIGHIREHEIQMPDDDTIVDPNDPNDVPAKRIR